MVSLFATLPIVVIRHCVRVYPLDANRAVCIVGGSAPSCVGVSEVRIKADGHGVASALTHLGDSLAMGKLAEMSVVIADPAAQSLLAGVFGQ